VCGPVITAKWFSPYWGGVRGWGLGARDPRCIATCRVRGIDVGGDEQVAIYYTIMVMISLCLGTRLYALSYVTLCSFDRCATVCPVHTLRLRRGSYNEGRE